MEKSISVIDLLDFKYVEKAGSKPANPERAHIVKQLKPILGVDAAYFSGDFPTVYFKKVDAFIPEILKEVAEIQKKIWNQGKVAFLYVESDNEVRIYNCYATPVLDRNAETIEEDLRDNIELGSFRKREEHDIQTLKEIFGRVSIDSGRFWKSNYGTRFNSNQRMQSVLVNNLKKVRSHLRSKGIQNISIIHNLLLRSLFLFYLDDRGATDAEFYRGLSPDAKSYMDILPNKEVAYRLFRILEQRFNGNLNPVTDEEYSIVRDEHLFGIKECFCGEYNPNNRQLSLPFRLFDFSVIPIQLISEIYEEFLNDGTGEDRRENNGEYYTPHSLVDFMLSKVLPNGTDDQNYSIKILDPACGSGIFLVESLNRLLDRWEISNPGTPIDFETIANIVKSNIFGIDINIEAIKVAAFSIYLTMLNRLEPKTLWIDKKFPILISQDDKKLGYNLYCMDSLSEGPFTKIRYDIVVGNPPWREGGLSKGTNEYLSKHRLPKEIAAGFIHRVAEIAPEAKIALVVNAKLLFNTKDVYKNLRSKLFGDFYCSHVYNFSVLRNVPKKRGGGQLFPSAIGPACILFYSASKPESPSDKIIYCAPKTPGSILKDGVSGFVIDSTDVKYLPRLECAKPDTYIWKIAMWGTIRDFLFVEKLSATETLRDSLRGELKKRGWSHGNGYQTSSPCDKSDESISRLPTVHAKNIVPYPNEIKEFTSTPNSFRRLGQRSCYYAPHILMKKGLKDNQLCVAYLEDKDCAFRDGVYGIAAPKKDAEILRNIAIYLSSKLARYLLFLRTSSEGIERDQILLTEYLSLPMIDINDDNWGIDISADEQALIDNIIDIQADSFFQKSKSNAYSPLTHDSLSIYLQAICEKINGFMPSEQPLRCWGKIYEMPLQKESPLAIASIHFNDWNKENHIVNEKADITGILSDLDAYCYREYSQSIYFKKQVRYYNDDVIYIIKANEQRFWTASIAFDDFDAIISDILTSSKEHEEHD